MLKFWPPWPPWPLRLFEVTYLTWSKKPNEYWKKVTNDLSKRPRRPKMTSKRPIAFWVTGYWLCISFLTYCYTQKAVEWELNEENGASGFKDFGWIQLPKVNYEHAAAAAASCCLTEQFIFSLLHSFVVLQFHMMNAKCKCSSNNFKLIIYV